VARRAAEDEQVLQNVDDVGRPEPAANADRQAFASVFVDHVEHPELATVMGAILDEVIGPDVVGRSGRSRTHEP